MAQGRLAKDVQYLCRHVDSLFSGQARVREVDDNLKYLLLDILPKEGFYRGAKLRFKLVFPESYPNDVPTVICLDVVFHPNIELDYDAHSGSNVCVSLLNDWTDSMGLDHVVMAILFLMYHPNPEDALATEFDFSSLVAEVDHWEAVFEKYVRLSLAGKPIPDCGLVFPRLLIEDANEDEQKDDDADSMDVDEKRDKPEEIAMVSDDVRESPVPDDVVPNVSEHSGDTHESGTATVTPTVLGTSGGVHADGKADVNLIDTEDKSCDVHFKETVNDRPSCTDHKIDNAHEDGTVEPISKVANGVRKRRFTDYRPNIVKMASAYLESRITDDSKMQDVTFTRQFLFLKRHQTT